MPRLDQYCLPTECEYVLRLFTSLTLISCAFRDSAGHFCCRDSVKYHAVYSLPVRASACHCCRVDSCRQQMTDWASMVNEIKAVSIKDFCLWPVFTSKSVSNLYSDLSCFCNPSLHSVVLIDTTFHYYLSQWLQNLPLCLASISVLFSLLCSHSCHKQNSYDAN